MCKIIKFYKFFYKKKVVELKDEGFKLRWGVTGQKVTLIGVNTTSFRVSYFCLIIVNGRQLLHACGGNSFYFYCKECMGWQSCLFVCYGRQELRRTMDGGGSDCIEEGLQNAR
jgi:hypothetical protein